MARKHLSERERLILALLKVYKDQPTSNISQIVYPGQSLFLKKQNEYLLRTLNRLQNRGFLTRDSTNTLWSLTDSGRVALVNI